MPTEKHKARLLTSIVTFIYLLTLPAVAQERTRETVQLRIEAVGTNQTYDRDSSIPIRCRFKNTGETSVSLALPGLGSRRMGLTSLGLEITVKRENEEAPAFHGETDFRSEFCRSMSEKLDSEVECDSPRDVIDLHPHEEFVRTVHLRTLLSGVGKSGWKIQPGKYVVQLTSNQAGGMLVSNELTIQVKP